MITITKQDWDLNTIESILIDEKIVLSNDIESNVNKNRIYLEKKVEESESPIYGINTGFGSLCDVAIPQDSIHQLQTNLVRSHACGTGKEVPSDIVRLIQALKIKNLSFASSGIRYELLDHMVNVYNAGIQPLIYQQGSLGASGDLAPLAHLALCLMGEGEAHLNGEKRDALWALTQKKLNPISLRGKEGLALLNGTQFSTSYLAYAVYHGERLFHLSNLVTSLSYYAYDCGLDPLDMRIHHIRRQEGQIKTAEQILSFLKGSGLQAQNKEYVQDPYAFRCVPQVHGASYDALQYAKKIMLNEINAVTDNPLVFSETDAVLSGGNFHAQPIALACDFLAIALAELGSISERRVYNLIDGKRNLPSYLTEKSGLNSGFMIAQYTAAAIVSENKQLCTPASVDSITSSKGQEDHVSMAANAGRKLYTVVENLYQLIAIEMVTACQAIDFRGASNLNENLSKVYNEVRKTVPFIKEDVVLGELLREGKRILHVSYDALT
jgi:histidine ammonia-lyase